MVASKGKILEKVVLTDEYMAQLRMSGSMFKF